MLTLFCLHVSKTPLIFSPQYYHILTIENDVTSITGMFLIPPPPMYS